MSKRAETMETLYLPSSNRGRGPQPRSRVLGANGLTLQHYKTRVAPGHWIFRKTRSAIPNVAVNQLDYSQQEAEAVRLEGNGLDANLLTTSLAFNPETNELTQASALLDVDSIGPASAFNRGYVASAPVRVFAQGSDRAPTQLPSYAPSQKKPVSFTTRFGGRDTGLSRRQFVVRRPQTPGRTLRAHQYGGADGEVDVFGPATSVWGAVNRAKSERAHLYPPSLTSAQENGKEELPTQAWVGSQAMKQAPGEWKAELKRIMNASENLYGKVPLTYLSKDQHSKGFPYEQHGAQFSVRDHPPELLRRREEDDPKSKAYRYWGWLRVVCERLLTEHPDHCSMLLDRVLSIRMLEGSVCAALAELERYKEMLDRLRIFAGYEPFADLMMESLLEYITKPESEVWVSPILQKWTRLPALPDYENDVRNAKAAEAKKNDGNVIKVSEEQVEAEALEVLRKKLELEYPDYAVVQFLMRLLKEWGTKEALGANASMRQRFATLRTYFAQLFYKGLELFAVQANTAHEFAENFNQMEDVGTPQMQKAAQRNIRIQMSYVPPGLVEAWFLCLLARFQTLFGIGLIVPDEYTTAMLSDDWKTARKKINLNYDGLTDPEEKDQTDKDPKYSLQSFLEPETISYLRTFRKSALRPSSIHSELFIDLPGVKERIAEEWGLVSPNRLQIAVRSAQLSEPWNPLRQGPLVHSSASTYMPDLTSSVLSLGQDNLDALVRTPIINSSSASLDTALLSNLKTNYTTSLQQDKNQEEALPATALFVSPLAAGCLSKSPVK